MHTKNSQSAPQILIGRLLMNQNTKGKLKTCKIYQKEPNFSNADIYVRRVLKGQEPRANFLICISNGLVVDLFQ